MRAAKQQAGRVPLVCGTVNMLFSPGVRILQCYSWLVTGSALCTGLVWGCSSYCFDGLATNAPEEVHFFRKTLEVAVGWVYLRHFQHPFSNPWLLATVIGTRMPIQEREQWADNYVEQVDEKRNAWLTIPFVRSLRDDRSLSTAGAEGVVVLGWSILLSAVPVEFIHGRNRSRSHKHDLWSNCIARGR